MNKNKQSNRPLFAFTAAAGVFPGAPDTDSFWKRIIDAEPAKLSALGDRWGLKKDAYYNSEPGTPNRIYLDKAYCLPEITSNLHKDEDNPNFEDISKRNSGVQYDYGKKVLKTLASELAIDGQMPSFLNTALVAGTSWSDQGYYLNDINYRFHGKKNFEKRFSPDEQLNELAGCIGIKGPSIAVDTACASSLYAVETAINIIRSGQANSAVVLGLSAVIPPFLMSAFSQLMALSPAGESLPFSKDASGMVPGEAAAAVFIEPLKDAVASGRKILGVLCSTGLSSDGSEGSVFAPGATGQYNAYNRAYKSIDPSNVDYVEAHGTATVLGDKTELEGIKKFFEPHLTQGTTLYVGTVKSLVGHSLAAAGMCSLIKALLMLKHKTIPPHIDVIPNSVIENSCIGLAKKPIPLNTSEKPAKIGVSSFGFGGSNAHIVLESYDERFHYLPDTNTNDEALFPDIAIVDFEAAFGDKLSTMELKQHVSLKQNQAIYQTGKFPDEITIDAAGLRSGPKFLKRIDASQNLVVHLANTLLKRHPNVKGSDDAAVIMSNNIGSSKSCSMARKYYADYYLTGNNKNIPDTTLEDISSGLGSMFSGYPAYHFDMKGFHQTCSGGTSSFWTTLLAAPSMLKEHCKTLIAGAGHFIKSPIDTPGDRTNGPVLEGTALFLLKTSARAIGDNDTILASINAIIPSSLADNFEKACRIAKIDPDCIDIRGYSQLDPASDYKQGGRQKFTGEATGCDVLSSILLQDGNNAAIEVYDDKKLLFTVFIKKQAEFSAENHPMTLPLTIAVSDTTDYIIKQTPEDNSDTKIRVLSDLNQPKQEVDKTDSESLEIFKKWHESTASTVLQFLKIQKTAAAMKKNIQPTLGQNSVTGATANIKKPENSHINSSSPVLRAITKTPPIDGSTTFYAQLIVDESHPYFFDHPLDHIPGILILHGVLDLFYIAAKDLFQREMFISDIEVDFKKICEKSQPVIITVLMFEKEPGKPLKAICEAVQNDNSAARIKLEAKNIENDDIPDSDSELCPPEPFPDLAILHKHKAENVLVSDYKQHGEKLYFYPVPPPEGHILGCNERNHYSMVYILEITRQCGMIIIHTVENVPLKTPMILLSFKVSLERPVYASQNLKISHKPTQKDLSGKALMGAMAFSLHDDKGRLGNSSISTLIVK